MSNKYLEKIAGVGSSLKRGAELLTGSKLREYKALHKALVRKPTYMNNKLHRAILKGSIRMEASDVAKARIKAGVGAGVGTAVIAGAGALKSKEANEPKYTVKSAGLSDFMDDLTGSKVRKNKIMMDALSEAEASGKKFTDYASNHSGLREAAFKARFKTGLGVAGVAGAGLYGLHKYKQHQRDKIIAEYKDFYKQASFGGFIQSAGRAASKGFGSFLDKVNTINGGKVNTFAEQMGISMKSKAGKKFRSGAVTQQARDLVRAARKTGSKTGMSGADLASTRKETMNNFRNLQRDRMDARMGMLGKGGLAAGTFAVGKHYGTKQNPSNNGTQSYYY